MPIEKPRTPTDLEILQIVECECDSSDPECCFEVQGHLQSGRVAVFDHYITDSPGYAGKVIVVIWPGSPNMVSVFIQDSNGSLQKQELE